MIFVRSTLREFTAAGIAVFLVLLVDHVHHPADSLARLCRRRWHPDRRRADPAGIRRAGLSFRAAIRHAVSIGAVERHARLPRFRDGGLAKLRPGTDFAGSGPSCCMRYRSCSWSALLSLYLTPWAIGKTEQYRHQLENRDDVSAVAPGVFKESKNGERVFFVEKVSTDLRQVANIFVHSTQDQRRGVMVAKRGYTELKENGDRYLVLVNGRRYEGTPGQADYRVVHFERYAVRIEQKEDDGFLPIAEVAVHAPADRESDAAEPIRADVACRPAGLGADAGLACDTAVRGQSAHAGASSTCWSRCSCS